MEYSPYGMQTPDYKMGGFGSRMFNLSSVNWTYTWRVASWDCTNALFTFLYQDVQSSCFPCRSLAMDLPHISFAFLYSRRRAWRQKEALVSLVPGWSTKLLGGFPSLRVHVPAFQNALIHGWGGSGATEELESLPPPLWAGAVMMRGACRWVQFGRLSAQTWDSLSKCDSKCHKPLFNCEKKANYNITYRCLGIYAISVFMLIDHLN